MKSKSKGISELREDGVGHVCDSKGVCVENGADRREEAVVAPVGHADGFPKVGRSGCFS